MFCRYQVNVLKWLLSEIQILSFHFKSALSEKYKNLSQEFMKMKAKKEQNEQIMTEFFLDLIMISKKTFLLLYAKPWDYVLNL